MAREVPDDVCARCRQGIWFTLANGRVMVQLCTQHAHLTAGTGWRRATYEEIVSYYHRVANPGTPPVTPR